MDAAKKADLISKGWKPFGFEAVGLGGWESMFHEFMFSPDTDISVWEGVQFYHDRNGHESMIRFESWLEALPKDSYMEM